MPPKPSEPTDPHAGHQMPSAPATDAHHAHAGHEPGIPDPPVGPPSAAALSGPSHAADAFFGAATMAPAREVVRKEHGDIKSGMILIDQLEAVIGKGKDGYAWNAQGWRSEEHTSELQSLMRISYAVFCLKKINTGTSR